MSTREREVEPHVLGERLAYSVATAAIAVGISETVIKQEIAAHRLPIKKVGRRTVIRRADLMAWLDSLPESS